MDTQPIATEAARLVGLALANADRNKKWLSEKTGIPYSTLGRKLQGHTAFDLGELYMIGVALGVSPSDLLPPPFFPRSQKAVA
jgi:hypothetical protein